MEVGLGGEQNEAEGGFIGVLAGICTSALEIVWYSVLVKETIVSVQEGLPV
jgi:hypothetical protein